MQARRLRTPEPARSGVARGRPRRADAVYARLLEGAELRRRCQAGLNKSEQRHLLIGAICTFKQGRIADRTHEAQHFRASGLNLVIPAIAYWNSTYIADAVAYLRAKGSPVPDHMLAHSSPVGWGHFAFLGDFLWDRAALIATARHY